MTKWNKYRKSWLGGCGRKGLARVSSCPENHLPVPSLLWHGGFSILWESGLCVSVIGLGKGCPPYCSGATQSQWTLVIIQSIYLCLIDRIRLHGVTSQKAVIILAAMRTWNLEGYLSFPFVEYPSLMDQKNHNQYNWNLSKW
jgi:hypothetical protein